MSKPQLRAVDNERSHPRDVARQAVKRWRSDAERKRLPVTNIHDDKGAQVLRPDEVLGHASHEARLGRR